MKSLTTYITEKIKISSDDLDRSYNYFPQTKGELYDIIYQLLEERGNDGDFNDIDVSKITDMSELFEGMKDFNGDISKWNVSNVKYMERMFRGCRSFNQDISNWLLNNDTFTKQMFENCPIEEKHKPKYK